MTDFVITTRHDAYVVILWPGTQRAIEITAPKSSETGWTPERVALGALAGEVLRLRSCLRGD